MLPNRFDIEVDITSSDDVKLTIKIFYNFSVEETDKFCQDYSIRLEDQVGTTVANHFKQYEIKDIMERFDKTTSEAIELSLPHFIEIGIRVDNTRYCMESSLGEAVDKVIVSDESEIKAKIEHDQNKILEYHNRIVDHSLINCNYLFDAKTKIEEFFCTMKQDALERVYKTHAINQEKVDKFDLQLGEARETGCLPETLIVPELVYRPFAIHVFFSNETRSELVGNINI